MHLGKHTLLTFALLTALASGSGAQTTLRYQFKEKDRFNYVIEQKTKSVHKILEAAEVVTHVNVTMKLYWEVVKVDTQGNAQVKIKFTHSKMSMESLLAGGIVEVDSNDKNNPPDFSGRVLGQVNKAFANMEISATMLPTGEMKDVKVSEATVKALKAIPGADQLGGDLAHPDNFKDMLSSVVFSAAPVAKGKSWTHNAQTQSPEGVISTEHVFTLEDPVVQDGVKLDKISLSPKVKVAQADPKAIIKVNSITMSGNVLFDNKAGRFVSSTVQQVKKGKIDVMGISLDSTSDQTTTMRILGQSAEEKLEAARKIESVKIDETEYVEKVVAKQQLETIAGVSRSFTLKRAFEPNIVMDGKVTASEDLKAKVGSALDLTIGQKMTVTESVALDGKEVLKVDVEWIERYRRGTAVASDGSQLSFLVKVELRLKVEKAK